MADRELESFAEIIESDDTLSAGGLDATPGDMTNEMEESHNFDLEGSLEQFHVLNHSLSWEQNNEAVTNALNLCSKYILNPYNGFLKVIGWRKFEVKKYEESVTIVKCMMRVCNVVYPFFIFMMLVMACIAQMCVCFSRTRSQPPKEIPNSKYSVLDCNDHTVTGDVIIYMCLLIAYWGALYVFRFAEAEHLSSLSQSVFISFSFIDSSKKWSTSVTTLILFLVSGICWFCFSGVVNILRLFGLKLHMDTTIVEWYTTNATAVNQLDYLTLSPDSYSALHYTFMSFSFVGFVFFDFLYIAVVINYCLQCQLLTFYVENIKQKILTKKYNTLNEACKELYSIYEFLKVLNGKLAKIMTLIAFLFAYNVITSYINLSGTDSGDELNIALGFLNIIQWLLALSFPIAMATRFTGISRSLRALGLQIATRPFVYRETPDLELQFFLTFMSTTEYQARLAFIPMHPSLVLGTVFILLLGLSLGIGIPHLRSLSWF